MATKKPRYMISVDDNMFEEIENYRYEKRFPTRSEATTELIKLGLEVIKKEREELKRRKKISQPQRIRNERSSYGENA